MKRYFWYLTLLWTVLILVSGGIAALAAVAFALGSQGYVSALTLYGIAHLGLSEERSGYLFFLAALGIAGGSVLAGRLSGRMIEFGIVPLGALSLTLSALVLARIASGRCFEKSVTAIIQSVRIKVHKRSEPSWAPQMAARR